MNNELLRILESALISRLERDPVVFRRADERGIRPVANVCGLPHDNIRPPNAPLNLNAFFS